MTDRRGEEEQPKGPKRRASRQGAAYQGAFEAVIAILIAAFLGNLADDHFGTAPRYVLVGFAIGFAAFVLRLVRLGRHLQEPEPGDESEDQ
jgi:F0F1-type ATP synthase assembly protein I